MDTNTKMRAMRLLLFINDWKPLQGCRADERTPFAYVVKDKCFFEKHAAEAWRKQTKDGMKYNLESVSLVEALEEVQMGNTEIWPLGR